MFVVAFLAAVMSQAFRHLTITDEGDRLLLAYGPLPFGLEAVEVRGSAKPPTQADRRSSDGWGMHYIVSAAAGRTTCGAAIACSDALYAVSTVRVGTDDVAGLLATVQSKIEADAPLRRRGK